jgi:hypothetical protein
MSAWALVSGLVGALLVFILGVIREVWRNNREKLGLLRLLLAEVEHNVEVSRTIEERQRDVLDSPDFPHSIHTETWRNVRTTAAGLLPKVLWDVLNEYYSPLQTLLTLLQFDKSVSDRADRVLRKGAAELRPDWEVPATRNPYEDYRDKALKAQEEAKKLIKKYFELRWWRRWLDFLISPVKRQEEEEQRTPAGNQEKTQKDA